MNYCAIQGMEEMRSAAAAPSAGDRRNMVFCPKPRRVGHLLVRPPPPLTSEAADIMDLFLTKGGGEVMSSSPPFFCGSPPSRAANPVVHDARFGEVASSSPMSPRKGGCARAKFGLSPAAVRVEGFDCRLDRDRRSSGGSITAVA